MLRELGLKVTPQRKEIVKYIFANNHCSAPEIKEHTDKVISSVSYSTIYLTAGKLAEAGIIIPVSFEPGVVRYDTNTEPHLHVVCYECGHVTEVPFNIGDHNFEELLSENGFNDIAGFDIHFFAKCKECSRSVKK